MEDEGEGGPLNVKSTAQHTIRNEWSTEQVIFGLSISINRMREQRRCDNDNNNNHNNDNNETEESPVVIIHC